MKRVAHHLAAGSLGLALLTSGCVAKLETDIRIFDPDCLGSEDVLRPSIDRVRAQLQAKSFEAMQTQLRDQADQAWAEAGLPDATRASYDAKVDKLEQYIVAAAADARRAVDYYDEQQWAAARKQLREVNAQLTALVADYDDSIRKVFGADTFELLGAEVDAIQARVAGGELFGDPNLGLILYAVGADETKGATADKHAKAAEACWAARIDHTETSAKSGNGDIAVNMRDDGTFTVKGLRLDASKVTQAIFRISTQAVCTVASIYGVGGCSTTQASVEAAGSVDPDLIELDIRGRKRAALQMLEEVVQTPSDEPEAAAGPLEAGLPALSATIGKPSEEHE